MNYIVNRLLIWKINYFYYLIFNLTGFEYNNKAKTRFIFKKVKKILFLDNTN